MCFHQIDENAMNIIKIYKDVSPTWKGRYIYIYIYIFWHNEPGRPLKPLPSQGLQKNLINNYFFIIKKKYELPHFNKASKVVGIIKTQLIWNPKFFNKNKIIWMHQIIIKVNFL